MALKFGVDENKLFQAVLIGFVAVQIVGWIISSYFPDIPLLKGGPMLFLFLIVILFSTLYTLGKNINQLSIKKDGIFIVLVFGAIIALFIFLPNIIPEIFSTSGMELREFLRETIGTIVQVNTGVV